ncbi:MAG TPA: hypothetical protein PLI09_10870 [Candidatus Hydrogenedentes bacterium]|nr:hypothetical protein [Candidatus Hydrogenedentota bacterium]
MNIFVSHRFFCSLAALATPPQDLVVSPPAAFDAAKFPEPEAVLWQEKQGPGWPSPYHKRALEFERESRGGGLQGPITLRKMNSKNRD